MCNVQPLIAALSADDANKSLVTDRFSSLVTSPPRVLYHPFCMVKRSTVICSVLTNQINRTLYLYENWASCSWTCMTTTEVPSKCMHFITLIYRWWFHWKEFFTRSLLSAGTCNSGCEVSIRKLTTNLSLAQRSKLVRSQLKLSDRNNEETNLLGFVIKSCSLRSKRSIDSEFLCIQIRHLICVCV